MGAAPGDSAMDNLAWLLALPRFRSRPGLDRMRELLAALGNPERALTCVLVAGTNGKGSVASSLAACLEAAGGPSGLFISPHLHHLGERIRVGGRSLDDARLDLLVGRLRPQAQQLGALFFEVLTAAALLHFAEAGVVACVLEVGLGGRFDPTNTVEPAVSLISAVAVDHQAILGDDVGTIAREKAGVLRPGVTAFSSAEGRALEVIRAEAARLGTPLAAVGEELEVEVLANNWSGLALAVSGLPTRPESGLKKGGQKRRLRLQSPLVGRHQAANVALAVAAARQLGVGDAHIRAGIAAVSWPGRLERIESDGRWVVLDGAHNSHGATALADALVELQASPGAAPAKPVAALIVAVNADKDLLGIVRPLLPLCRSLIVTVAASSPAPLAPAEAARLLASLAQEHGTALVVEPSSAAAMALALAQAPAGGTVLVAGSLYLVAEIRARLLARSAP